MKSSVRLIFALLLVSCLASLASKAWAKGIIRDPETLEISPGQLIGPSLLALAVNFAPDGPGQGAPVRLIDNRVLTPGPAA